MTSVADSLRVTSRIYIFCRETKTWILRCYGCFKTTPLMDKKFCPKCGNKTLKRVRNLLADSFIDFLKYFVQGECDA